MGTSWCPGTRRHRAEPELSSVSPLQSRRDRMNSFRAVTAVWRGGLGRSPWRAESDSRHISRSHTSLAFASPFRTRSVVPRRQEQPVRAVRLASETAPAGANRGSRHHTVAAAARRPALSTIPSLALERGALRSTSSCGQMTRLAGATAPTRASKTTAGGSTSAVTSNLWPYDPPNPPISTTCAPGARSCHRSRCSTRTSNRGDSEGHPNRMGESVHGTAVSNRTR